ncbi:MAG: hypothetical protein ABWY78_09935 [Microvirga sp.]
MYGWMIVGLMGVLPIGSILAEWLLFPGGAGAAALVPLVGKWFVFWAAGVRLFLAGLRQIADPAFTAQTIFRIADPGAGVIVQELGFANVAIGILGIVSFLHGAWIVPAALAGCVFLGLAGGRHVLNANRTRTETIALVSDLWIAAVLAAFLVATLVAPGLGPGRPA